MFIFSIIEAPKWYDDRVYLDTALNESPFEPLNLIFKKFKELEGKELEEVVESKFAGNKENAYQHLSTYTSILIDIKS